MSEDDVIQRRLVLEREREGEDRKLNIMIKMISKWINNTNQTEEESRVMFDRILAQLSLVENSRRHSDHVRRATEEQLQHYKLLFDQMELKIYLKKQEITDQKKELEKARIAKQNRVRYHLLAKTIEQNPTRTETTKTMKQLNQELAILAGQKKKLENQISYRKKEFSVLASTSDILAALLESDVLSTATAGTIRIITRTRAL